MNTLNIDNIYAVEVFDVETDQSLGIFDGPNGVNKMFFRGIKICRAALVGKKYVKKGTKRGKTPIRYSDIFKKFVYFKTPSIKSLEV